MRRPGRDPRGWARRRAAGRFAAYVELHIEQGSALDGLGAAIGVAEGIWPHGRWRIDFTGRADHAGTTRLADRRDPMLPYAPTVLEARQPPVRTGRAGHLGRVSPNRAGPTPSAPLCSLARCAGTRPGYARRVVSQTSGPPRTAARPQEVGVSLRRGRVSPTGRVRPRRCGTGLPRRSPAAGFTAPVLATGAVTTPGAGRADPDRHAVRPTRPAFALTGRARRASRLRGRRHRARGGARGPGRRMSGPAGSGPARRRAASRARLAAGRGVCTDVLIEAAGGRLPSPGSGRTPSRYRAAADAATRPDPCQAWPTRLACVPPRAPRDDPGGPGHFWTWREPT